VSDFNYEFFIPEDIEQFSDPQLAEAEMLDSITQWVNCGNMTRDEGDEAYRAWLDRR
jgi:hypothetical protein